MIYLLLTASLVGNGILIWYIRKVLTKFWYDLEARKSFATMLSQYEEALTSIYKLEEFYGEETLKKAIQQTRFVVEACEEFKKILEESTIEEAESGEENEGNEEGEEADQENTKKEAVIRLKEGESVSQDASSYKRVIREQV